MCFTDLLEHILHTRVAIEVTLQLKKRQQDRPAGNMGDSAAGGGRNMG